MIHLNVDEAYAFDFISVLDIKKDNSQKDLLNFIRVSGEISSQIGQEAFTEILRSNEYAQLLFVNKKIYDLIDTMRASLDPIDARIVDDANTERFLLKRKLQERFFSSELTENKNNR